MIISIDSKSRLYLGFSLVFVLSLAVSVVSDSIYPLLIPVGGLCLYAGLKNPFLVYLALVFSIPFSTEFNFSASLGTDLPDEPLMWILCLVFMFLFPIFSGWYKKVLSHPLIILLAGWLMWMIVTSLFSSAGLLSFKFIASKTWYITVFVLLPLVFFRSHKKIFITAGTLLVSMVIVTGIIVWKHAQYDFSFASVNQSVIPFFRNHVNYGALLVCMIPVAVGFYARNKNINQRFSLLMAIAFFLFALLFSYSRGAWIALLTGAIAVFLMKKKLLLPSFILIIITGIAAVSWLRSNDRYLDYVHDYKTTIFHRDFKQHFISTYKLKDLSTEERFYRWIAAIRMVKDNWLMGTGPNTFYPDYKEYAIPAFKTYVSDNPEHSTVHNYLLLTVTEQGIPGLIFFLVLTGAVFYYAQKNYHQSKSQQGRMIALTTGSVFTMIITLNMLSDLVETDKIGSLFFLCIAVLITQNMRLAEEVGEDTRLVTTD